MIKLTRILDSIMLEAMYDDQHSDALRKTGFWGKQGAGCIFLAKDTKRILLPLRSRMVEQPGTWGVWGGAIDPGENPKDAVRREAMEEVGYRGSIHLFPMYIFKKNSFQYHNFLAIVPREFEPELNWETDDFAWVKFGHWPQPLHFGLEYLLQHAGDKIEKIIQRLDGLSEEHPHGRYAQQAGGTPFETPQDF